MKKTVSTFAAATATLMAAAVSQSSTFRMDPAVMLSSAGANITYDLTASSGTVFAMLADIDSGPVDLFGERFYLGFSPTLVTLRAGLVPPIGVAAGSLPIPALAGIVGIAVYGQGAVIDAASPNNLFRVTNAESSLIYGTPRALVVDFDNPASHGFTGSYSQQVVGHISGGAVTRRTHITTASQGYVFPQPLQNPLNPNGCREQMVFRSQDVGATGDRELVTAIRWYSMVPLVADSFQQFELAVGHSPVVPNYDVDPFTALPVAPGSGLAAAFASNYASVPPQPVFQGRYDLTPALRRPDGYVPLPVFAPFAYDGSSSLLLEFKTHFDPQASGINGMYGSLMVQSSPNPAARSTAGGTISQPVNPSQVTIGVGDNWMANMQIEFARVETTALSPFYNSGLIAPDYGTPLMSASLPPGTSVQIEYRGRAGVSTTPTAWSSTPEIADGLAQLQFRMTFYADLISGEVPVVDTLVVQIH